MNETHTGQSLIRSTVLTKSLHQDVISTEIPQFFFPQGKPLDSVTEQSNRSTINTLVGEKLDIPIQKAKNLVVDVLGLPSYFSVLLILRCTNNPQSTKITKMQFNKVWKELEAKSPAWRAFWLLSSQPKKKYIVADDFKILFKEVMEVHPGLQFLKESPEFQVWYSLCVIYRMYYMANRKYDGKLTYRYQ